MAPTPASSFDELYSKLVSSVADVPVVVLLPLAAVGGLYVSSYVLSFVRLVFSLFILPGKSLRSFGPKGSWALVTGASDGIGLEYATQLARAQYNVMLVSRTESKLAALAQKIESTSSCNVKVSYLPFDFAHAREDDWERFAIAIKELDIAVLVNNVGRSHDMPVTFADTSLEEMQNIITINCTGTLRVTSLVLPGMQKRRRGLILTMGSFGGLMPSPLLATYSGSKAFLQYWSTALGAEVAPYNITVELVQSYLVTSAMSKIRRASAMIPTPKAFVRSVLTRIGRSGGAQQYPHSSTPFWSHGIMQWSIATFVGLFSPIILGINKSMHESIRKRALKKKERDAKKSK